MRNLIVGKFGGTSLADLARVEFVNRIIQQSPDMGVVVLSGPGKRFPEDEKVTDQLIDGKIESVVKRFKEIYPEVNNFEGEIYSRKAKCDEKNLDALVSFGEYIQAKSFANKYGYKFVDAIELFLVENGQISEKSFTLIREKLGNEKGIVIVPGFYGVTKEGKIRTFPRGGSDITGAWIAAALNVKEYQNFTDYKICTTDPKLLNGKSPREIECLTFDELRDLSYLGFGIFHPEAVRPLKENSILTHVRATSEFPRTGTYVLTDRFADYSKPITGVAYTGNLVSIDIQKDGLNEMRGVGLNVLKLIHDEGLSYEFFPGAVDDISVVMKLQDKIKKPLEINRIIKEIYSKVGDDSKVKLHSGLSAIAVAGKALEEMEISDVYWRIERAFFDAKIPVGFRSQGSTKRCMIYGVPEVRAKEAIKVIFDEFPYLYA